MFKRILLIAVLLNFSVKCDLKVNVKRVNTFVFAKSLNETFNDYDYAIYWNHNVEMNNYCNIYYGLWLQFNFKQTDLSNQNLEMCFHEYINQNDGLGKTFYITNYLDNHTWPTETGLYVEPKFFYQDLFKSKSGYTGKFINRGYDPEANNITKWCLSGDSFSQFFKQYNETNNLRKQNSDLEMMQELSLTIIMQDINGSSPNCKSTNFSRVVFCNVDSPDKFCSNHPPSLNFETKPGDNTLKIWLIVIFVIIAVVLFIVLIAQCLKTRTKRHSLLKYQTSLQSSSIDVTKEYSTQEFKKEDTQQY